MAFNPIIFQIFGIKFYWYGLVYALGFFLSYFFIKENFKNCDEKTLDKIYFFIISFSLIGGRLFHIIFYNFSYYLKNPLKIFFVWEGGMSSHGALIFGVLSCFFICKKYKKNPLIFLDLISISVCFFMAFGRLANFLNQELVGKITTSKIGVVFPKYDKNLRLPYQLFASFKNMIVFQILFYLQNFKKLKPGEILSWFLILYNLLRFFLDFTREVNVSILFISMSQLLSLLLGIFGIVLLMLIKKNKNGSVSQK